jgi:hypothetical protein
MGSLVLKTAVLGVGFSWISLDSLVRIQPFQWVTMALRGKLFLGAFPGGWKRDKGRVWFWGSEALEISSGKHSRYSDFQQGNAV